MKPLDIVKTPKGGWALVTEVGTRGEVSIEYLLFCNPGREKNAWWDASKLLVVDSIPRLLANACAHNMGDNTRQGDRFFSVSEDARTKD